MADSRPVVLEAGAPPAILTRSDDRIGDRVRPNVRLIALLAAGHFVIDGRAVVTRLGLLGNL